MAQVIFGKGEFQGELQFNIETHFDGSVQVELSFGDFDDLNYYLQNFYKKNYKELFTEKNISHVELLGISFKGRKDSERFAVHLTEGWKQATIMFDESKFGDVNVDKLKRIKDILNE